MNTAPIPQGSDDLLTKKELAARLKKTPRTVDNWRRRDMIPCLKAGRCVLFVWRDVLDALQSQTPRRSPASHSLSPRPVAGAEPQKR